MCYSGLPGCAGSSSEEKIRVTKWFAVAPLVLLAGIAVGCGAVPQSGRSVTRIEILRGSDAQISYNASISTAVVPYPSTIPCPYSGSGCTAGNGSLTGANHTVTPSDFGNPITRLTDDSTMSTANSYNWSYTGAAYALPIDITDTRFTVYTNGNEALPMSWNPGTRTAAKLYGTSYTLTPQPASTVGFSYTQPYVGYAIAFNGSNDPAIYSWNFSSTVTAPTAVQVVDLATCVSALSGVGDQWNGELTVSQDDQTFAVSESTTSGQGSSGAVYVIVWNRTNGCRVWNTSNGAVTGAWGTTGTIGVADEFTIHDSTIGEGGTWVEVIAATCLNNSCAASPTWLTYLWDISTLTVNGWTDNSRCGHSMVGYSYSVNSCDYNTEYNSTAWYESLNSAPNIGPPTYVLNTPMSGAGSGLNEHPGWQMDNSSDTNPFCDSTYNTTQFAPVNVYDDEILCHQTSQSSGSNVIWRFAHTYATGHGASFEAEFVIGAPSADGRWFLWTSDWDGMLGNTNGSSNSCTIGRNCRNDVFIVGLTGGP